MNLGDELNTIREEHGKLTPALVRDTARPRNHPLHDHVFDRNQKEASETYYLQRAHELIVRCRATYREAEGDQPALRGRRFHAVRTEEPEGFVYEPIEVIVTSEFTTRLVLQSMEHEWKQLYQKYQDFGEFVEMVQADLGEEKAA